MRDEGWGLGMMGLLRGGRMAREEGDGKVRGKFSTPKPTPKPT